MALLAFDELDQLAVLLNLRLGHIFVVCGIEMLDVSNIETLLLIASIKRCSSVLWLCITTLVHVGLPRTFWHFPVSFMI
jgi:hypothetical protein